MNPVFPGVYRSMNSPVIQLRLKGRLLQTLPFEGDALRIGRLKENDIVISNASVSRFHAVLRREDDQVVLEDSGSENGCYVNGTRVEGRIALEAGDEIAIGKHQLVLKEGADENTPAPEVARDGKNDAWDASKTYFVGAETQAKMLENLGAEPGAVTDPEREADPSLDQVLEAAVSETAPEEIEPPADEPVLESVEELIGEAESEPIDVDAEELEAWTPEADELVQGGQIAVIDAPVSLDEESASGAFEFGAEADLAGPAGEADEEIDVREYEVESSDEEPREDAEQAIEIPGIPAPEVEPAEEPIWHAGLIVQNRGKLDRIISWDRDQLVAGRSSDCDIYLEEAEVSRRHAVFVREDGGYEVRDLDSVNGLLVNGEKSRGCSLEVGDVVKIEGFEFTFLLDRHPICSEVKTDAPPGPDAGEAAGGFHMTMLQEELPIGPAITNPSALVESPLQPEESGSAEVPAVGFPGLDDTEEEADSPELPAIDQPLLDAAEEPDEPPELPAEVLYPLDDVEEEERPEPAAIGLYGSDAAESEELIEVEEVSSPSHEVEGPGVPVVTEEALRLEVKVRLADLPEPLRAALAELEETELKLPVEIVLKTDD